MKHFNTGRVQDKLINRLERQEKKQAFQRDRFLKFKMDEIHKGLIQELLMEEIVETDNNAALSDLLMRGLKKLLRTNEFDYKYFIAPIRDVVPRPNPISLYITQYILEVILNDPNIIDVYGTDVDIYKAVNKVISNINMKFERTEEKILKQLANNKSLTPGSREYDIAFDQLVRKMMGDPQAESNPR
jgi:ribosome-associated translation inhibitor RaiA